EGRCSSRWMDTRPLCSERWESVWKEGRWLRPPQRPPPRRPPAPRRQRTRPVAPMAGAEAATTLSPLAAALLEGRAPAPIRLAAARGVLPLARQELWRVLVALLRDGDPQVRAEATARLGAIKAPEIEALLGDPGSAPELLHHFALDPTRTPRERDLL